MIANCKCAKLIHQMNADGARRTLVIGKTTCIICRGRGKVQPCSTCEGCGLVAGGYCHSCGSSGRIPA